MNQYTKVYSDGRGWGVSTAPDLRFLWSCRSEDDATELARELNKGTPICRGCPILRNNCGRCAKCRLAM